MQLQPGTIIKSTEALKDTVFDDAIIYIAEFNEKGAVGYIINKLFGRSLNELQEFRHSIPFPLYNGGPVDQEHLFFLHRRPDLIEDGIIIVKGIYMGGKFEQAVDCINDNTATRDDIKIFVGYCGWDAGELEAEIEEGSWVVVEEMNETIFRE